MRADFRLNPLHVFAADRAGSTAPIFAMCLFAIVSLIGATIALSMDSRAANQLQASADAAALAGATAFINATSPRMEDRMDEARKLASDSARSNTQYALTQLEVGQIVEDPYGQHTEITVDLAFEPANPAAKMAGRNANIGIARKAKASATWGFPLCVLALNESGTGLMISGAANLVAENCIIWSNSKSGTSMAFEGGRAEAKYFCAAGNTAQSGGQVSPTPHEQCAPMPDPLDDWVAPAPGQAASPPAEIAIKSPDALLQQAAMFVSMYLKAVQTYGSAGSGLSNSGQGNNTLSQIQALQIVEDQMSDSPFPIVNDQGEFLSGPAKGMTLEELLQVSGDLDNVEPSAYANDVYKESPTLTLQPGTYRGLDIRAGHVEMRPGIYHIVDAPLIVRRRATLSGDGVTIVFHGEFATLNVLDEARLNITAPTDGETEGFVVAENRHTNSGSAEPLRSRLTGSGRVEAIGTIYLPRQLISITGDGAADQASPLLQIVAQDVELTNQGGLRIKFDTSKTDVPAKILPQRSARLLN
jgi:Flp pilus assembly protein TadG